jgi:hypothetical protein
VREAILAAIEVWLDNMAVGQDQSGLASEKACPGSGRVISELLGRQSDEHSGCFNL